MHDNILKFLEEVMQTTQAHQVNHREDHEYVIFQSYQPHGITFLFFRKKHFTITFRRTKCACCSFYSSSQLYQRQMCQSKTWVEHNLNQKTRTPSSLTNCESLMYDLFSTHFPSGSTGIWIFWELRTTLYRFKHKHRSIVYNKHVKQNNRIYV